jgi:hypothetical protein
MGKQNGTHPDHFGDPLHQRDQAPGQPVGSQLPADLYARYMRARGHEVLFLCATDEHGTPAELAAAKAGKPVAEYCAEMWEVQDELGRASASASTISAAPPVRRTTR